MKKTLTIAALTLLLVSCKTQLLTIYVRQADNKWHYAGHCKGEVNKIYDLAGNRYKDTSGWHVIAQNTIKIIP